MPREADSVSCVSDDNGTNNWQEVLKFMFDLANSGDPGLMESALHIFA